MFTRKEYSVFVASILLITIGFTLMAFDPADNGFGIATLWVAPPLLLIGFLLPVPAIVGHNNIHYFFSSSSMKLNKIKHLFGLLVFAVSLVLYFITLEPTASLWDCAEFIASAYKLQVPHTPGNPLLLLIGRMFSMLALGDVKKVAVCINAMSSIFSALTVFIVYHLIFYFGERISTKSNTLSRFALIAASLCGSLCLTFSDTFWFSAVEAETYGPACFFLLLLFALILKGKEMEKQVQSRMLVLIFYLSGLAYCIHPMCILTLPVLPIAWYCNKRKLTFRNVVILSLAGMMIVFLINRIFSTGVFELAFNLDLFLVNTLGMPFYSGVFVSLTVFTLIIRILLKRFPSINAYTWASVFLLFGFAPYLLLFIRSNHNPPIDENNPQDLAMIKAYMNRESYPSSPLLYGPYFDAQLVEVNEKKKIYFKGEKQYEFAGTMQDYVYEPKRNTILPRIYSNDPDHIAAYRAWTGLKNNDQPSFADNLKFMFNYQLGHMYMRYLLWNFAGREGDHQNSDWLKPWDSLQPMLNEANKNKARNQYWMIPLALGLIGAFVQFKRDGKNFYSTIFFFLLTGLILAVYLNSYPVEPRERDYIYVGSYIAFSIWIGLGVFAILHRFSNHRPALVTSIMVCASIPHWIAYQNFDDHNRAGRTFQMDNARNQLASCDKNAILFTGGDNDTFPLWYLQEVEGFRTDVRVMVMSYMNTDWYINELRKKYYASEPFTLTLGRKEYRQYGANDVLYIQDAMKDGINLTNYLQLLRKEHKALRRTSERGDVYSILPSRMLKLKVDTARLYLRSSLEKTDSEITFKISGNYAYKSALAILDLIASNHWVRPIYFNYTSLNTAGLELTSHVIQEGNVYRLLPITTSGDDVIVKTQLAYQNLIENADYSNLQNASLNFNYEDYQVRMITPLRGSFNTLAIAFLNEGNRSMAQKVMNFALKKLYGRHLPSSYINLQTAEILEVLGREDQAREIYESLFDFHYDQFQCSRKDGDEGDRENIYLMQQSARLLNDLGEKKYMVMLGNITSTASATGLQ